MDENILKEKTRQIRSDILDMLFACKSGHPGGSLSCVEIISALYYNVINTRPGDTSQSRDKFVLSKGHACPTLYAVLADLGYFDRSELATLRKIDSHLQGHPDMTKTPGIDANTGSLGQGASIALGMAKARKIKGVGGRIFTLLGDGECQEGMVWEMAMAASHYKLDNLVVMLDHNGLQIDGTNDQVMSLGDISKKFEAFGFETVTVDGHDIDAITRALDTPHEGKPLFVECLTVKGKGVDFMEDQVGWHGRPMTEEEYKKAKSQVEVTL